MSFRVLFGGNCSNFFWYFFSGVCSVVFFPVFCPLPFVMVVGFWDRDIQDVWRLDYVVFRPRFFVLKLGIDTFGDTTVCKETSR